MRQERNSFTGLFKQPVKKWHGLYRNVDVVAKRGEFKAYTKGDTIYSVAEKPKWWES